jgi:flagellar basal body-associated protein FliL
MSEDAKAAEATGGDEVDTGPKPSKLPLLLGLVNSVAILAAVGTLAYTRILFKRPQITEAGEREKIAQMSTAPKVATTTGFATFDPITINIAPSPTQPKPADGTPTQIQGKLHYATIGFSIELRDIARKDELEAIKPLVIDQFLALVGRKQFHELTSVQGRYVLKTQLIEIVNLLATKRLPPGTAEAGPLSSNLFFNQFIVQ